MYTIFCTWLTTRKGYESVQASVCAWHVHTDFDVRRTSRTFSGMARTYIDFNSDSGIGEDCAEGCGLRVEGV
jgi:hypothetical protein